jgi:hypothetical protein
MSDVYWKAIRREPFLVGYWRMNDDDGAVFVADSGARYDLVGSYQGQQSRGSALISADSVAASVFAGAVSVCSGAQIPDAAPLRLTSGVTLEAWVNLLYGDNNIVLAKMDGGGTVAAPYSLRVANSAPPLLIFSLGNGTTQQQLSVPLDPAPRPIHVVATLFRGTMSLYVDGALATSGSLGTQSVSDAGQPLQIAAFPRSLNTNGLLAEAAVYSGALSALRVARHFALGRQILSDQAHFITVDAPVLA